MKKYKFELSPNQITNLQNRGIKTQNGKLLFPKERKSYNKWMNYITQYLFNRNVEV